MHLFVYVSLLLRLKFVSDILKFILQLPSRFALLHSVGGSAGQCMLNHISIRLERQIQPFVSPYVCIVAVTSKGRI